MHELMIKAVSGIVEQGGPAAEGGTCRYRADSGWKCAVGQIIPDELYLPGMEREVLSPASGVGRMLMEHYGLSLPDISALRDLQKCHDLATGSTRFLAAFREQILKTMTSVIGGERAQELLDLVPVSA